MLIVHASWLKMPRSPTVFVAAKPGEKTSAIHAGTFHDGLRVRGQINPEQAQMVPGFACETSGKVGRLV